MGTMVTTCCTDDSTDYPRVRNSDIETPLIEEPKKLEETPLNEKANNKDEEKKDEYYQKCVDLTKIISSSINTPIVIEHDSETHTNNWKYINSIAQVCEESLNALAKKLVNVKAFSDNENDNYNLIKIIKAIKDEQSVKEEVEKLYNGNWLRVVDACKENIIYNNFKELYFMLLMLGKYNQNCCGFEIISIKRMNKNNTPHIPNICVLVRPVQYSIDDEDQNKNNNKKDSILIDLKCTENELTILETLKLNMAVNDEDESQEDEEPEFLNLPAHVCEIDFIHKSVWDGYSMNI